eukprot:gnl/TRDRNA2_/TRDRNA2_119282_c1_seq1.p1 gnl/TRDRNA2_/TRDRNA2_119282_c1~~gnl/TRDRNA2_/TRDRNA2_119282_c1_seq1.p1  ORF type:complete len:104 (+),score=12.47 gnl/TRDRNA2_/TRDRNA2_119282_c1_seq1:102-413(+)
MMHVMSISFVSAMVAQAEFAENHLVEAQGSIERLVSKLAAKLQGRASHASHMRHAGLHATTLGKRRYDDSPRGDRSKRRRTRSRSRSRRGKERERDKMRPKKR